MAYDKFKWDIRKVVKPQITYWQGFYDGDYHFTAYSYESAQQLQEIRHNLWQKIGYPF